MRPHRGVATGSEPLVLSGDANPLKSHQKMVNSRELIPSWNGDGVFTGREPHNSHRNQMKLFKALAATAAVVTCCLGNQLPAQAQKYNGWKYIGASTKYGDMYAKLFSRSQGDARVLISSNSSTYESDVVCFNWVYRDTTKRYWSPIMPGSMMDSVAKKIC